MNDLISRSKAIRCISEQKGIVDKSVAKRILMQLDGDDTLNKIRQIIDDYKTHRLEFKSSDAFMKIVKLIEDNYGDL